MEMTIEQARSMFEREYALSCGTKVVDKVTSVVGTVVNIDRQVFPANPLKFMEIKFVLDEGRA